MRFFERRLPPALSVGVLTLVGLGVAGTFVATAGITLGEWGVFPLDDSYIHLRLVDNWLTGDGLTINPGEAPLPESSILWALLLMATGLIARPVGIPLESISLAMGVLFYLLAALTVWAAVRRQTRDNLIALMAGLTVLTLGRFVWAAGSGMEISLAAFLAVLLAHLDMRRPDRRFSPLIGVVGGLAALARPELALLVAMITFVRGLRPWRWGPWLEASIAGGMFLAHCLYHLVRTGAPIPNTMGARLMLMVETHLQYLWTQVILTLGYENAALWLLAVAACAAALLGPARRRLAPLWLWLLAHGIVSVAVFHLSLHNSRYVQPVLPALVMAVAISLPHLVRRLSDRRLFAARCGMALVLLTNFTTLAMWQRTYVANVSDIFRQQITIARWVNRTLPESAVLAINDIGALTYYTDRRIFDLAGLASPDVVEVLRDGPAYQGHGNEELAQMMVEVGCTHAIFFPRWYPGLSERADLLELIEIFELESTSISGDSLVYACRVKGEVDRSSAGGES